MTINVSYFNCARDILLTKYESARRTADDTLAFDKNFLESKLLARFAEATEFELKTQQLTFLIRLLLVFLFYVILYLFFFRFSVCYEFSLEEIKNYRSPST